MIILIVVLIVIAAGVVVVVALRSGPGENVTPPRSNQAQTTTTVHPSAPQGTPPKPESPEQEAEKAFDQLTRDLEALPPDDKTRRMARLESFLQRHGEAMVAARARVMLVQLQSPVPAAIDPAAQPEGEVVHLFNGKDLSNWEFGGGGDPSLIRITDGVMEVDPGFDGRIECSTPSRAYVFEVELFMENEQGAYVEIHSEHAGLSFNRSMAGEWIKVRVVDTNAPLRAKVLSGADSLEYNDGGIEGRFRVYFMKGSVKRVRAINLYPIK